jgi:glycosyltransferase involved in cell wall biosynthesis
VVHVITGLQMGGAESALTRVISRSDHARFKHVVVSLTGPGPLVERLPSSAELRIPPAPSAAASLRTVRGVVREVDADVLQTWLYKADLVGGLSRCGRPVVWNLRQSRVDDASDSRSNRLVAHLNARLARRLASKIVAVSDEAAEAHVALGYPRELMTVIGNGFDLEHFRPDPAARSRLRAEWGWTEREFVIAYVGRNHAVKDVPTMLRAAARVARRCPSARFVIAGEGLTSA